MMNNLPLRKHMLILLLVGWGVCIDVSQAQSKEKDHNKPSNVYLGLLTNSIANIDPHDARTSLNILFDDIKKSININVELNIEFFSCVANLKKAIQKEEVHFVSITSIDYLHWKDELNLKPLLVGTNNKFQQIKYLLLVHQNSKFKTLKSLANQRIIIQDFESNNSLPLIWFKTLLAKNNLYKKNTLYKKHEFQLNISKALLPVFFNQVAACIVNENSYHVMCELNPQVKNDLRVLASSQELLYGLFCATSKIDDNDYKLELLYKTVSGLELFPKGQQMLTIFKIQKLRRYKEEYIRNVTMLYQEYQKYYE